MMTYKRTSYFKHENQIGIVYGLLGSAMFSGYLLVNRYIYTTYAVETFSYVATFTIWAGFFGLLGVGFNRYKQKFQLLNKSTGSVLLNGAIAGVGVGVLAFGQSYTTAINASIIATGSIITTVIFSKLILKDEFNRSQYLWLIALFAGLYLAIVGTHTIELNKGDLLILSSGIFLGFSNVYSKILMKHNSSDYVSELRLVSGALLFAILGLAINGSDFFVTNAGLWPMLAGLFYWLTIKFFYASIHHINPNKAIVLVNSHPILTPVIGILALGEPYGWSKFLGSILILTSVFYINRK